MSEVATHLMTLDEFLGWQERQDNRFELVDGRPVAITGATFAHDRVVGNLRWAIKTNLRNASSPCEPFGADIGLVVSPLSLRRPDVAVYCPPFEETAVKADRPRLIAEVLSRSTEHVDYFIKVEEFKTIDALQVILLVSPQAVDLGVWMRGDGSWNHRRIRDIDGVVDLADLGISLAVQDIYDGVRLIPPDRPRLVWPEEPPQR